MQPFGTVQWDDTLIDLVLKFNRMNSIQHVSLLDEHRGSIDLSGLHERQDVLTHVTRFFAKSQAQYKTGKHHTKIFSDTLIVAAEPVLIHGVVFSFHIAYSPAPDMMTAQPDRVVRLHRVNEEIALPLRMMHVVVTKNQASVLTAKVLARLQAEMAAKYRSCAAFRHEDDEMFARDKNGRAFLARWRATEAFRGVEPGYTGSGLLQYRNR